MVITVHARNLKALFAAPYYFSIPSYQRPYKWGKDEIEDLLTDINDAYITSGNKKDTQYFLGAVVLQQQLHGKHECHEFGKVLHLYLLHISSQTDYYKGF